jgi:hypothetical protein
MVQPHKLHIITGLCMLTFEKGLLASIRNRIIFIIIMEIFPLHNLVYIEPIVTIQRNHSHVIRAILVSFALRKLVLHLTTAYHHMT